MTLIQRFRYFFLLSTFLAITLLNACQKEEGVGGTAKILGKILIQEYNGFGEKIKEYYAPQHDIFIIYGDNQTFDDVTSTHFNGAFRFSDLYPGEYTLYTYAGCNDCEIPTQPVFQTVEILRNGERIEIPPWVIIK